MITTGKILKFDKHGNKLLLELPESIERELIQKHIGSVELRLNDGRRISADQRRKIFAIVRDIALCHEHHMEAHIREKELFEENYIYGIKLDEYLCKKLRLNTKSRR